jgi:hypothetical protein
MSLRPVVATPPPANQHDGPLGFGEAGATPVYRGLLRRPVAEGQEGTRGRVPATSQHDGPLAFRLRSASLPERRDYAGQVGGAAATLE